MSKRTLFNLYLGGALLDGVCAIGAIPLSSCVPFVCFTIGAVSFIIAALHVHLTDH